MAVPLHHGAGHKETFMVNRAMHSAAARLAVGLIGTGVFVQASQHVSLGGMLAMALGSVLVISAGADVAPHRTDSAG